MAEVSYAAQALADLDRLEAVAEGAVLLILDAVDMLVAHPLIGRPCEHDLRELVISRGKTGHVALYDYDESLDRVIVRAIRHQRELE